jgi:Ca-activated chloride channel homolog
MIFSFSHPQYLFLLFAIPLMFFIHFFSLSNRKKNALKFANFSAIARIQGIDFFSKNLVILFLNLFAVFFIVLSVSGLNLQIEAQSSSFSYVIAIDSSQSMEASDFKPDRLTVSRDTAIDFVDSAPLGVSMGVVSFSGTASIEQELTQDKSEITKAIDEITLSSTGGTDLKEAIMTSSNLLFNEKNKAIVLLSDGQINVGTIQEAVRYATKNEIVIDTIGIGTLEGGQTSIAFSKLDEDSLKSLAYETGGEYFSASDQASLVDSFSQILLLTKRQVTIPLSEYLLIFATLLLILEFFLTNTRYVNLP